MLLGHPTIRMRSKQHNGNKEIESNNLRVKEGNTVVRPNPSAQKEDKPVKTQKSQNDMKVVLNRLSGK